ncbi:MAG TPA: MFS transporter [Streptosporangiales bacterium]
MLRRAIGASAIGNATEWYDYGVYGYLAITIGKAFFPGSVQATTLASLGLFAAGFLIRPFGGIILGPIGDRIGRQKVLAFTILVMSGCTFLIGVLPTYQQIGLAAPALLLLLRLIQGFSTGGEYGGAATFMAEYAPDKRRGFFGSFLEFGTLWGYIVGALVTLLFTSVFADSSWGWRIPFLLGLPLGLIGLYLRSRLEDTPVFRELEQQGAKEHDTKSQVREILGHWRPMLILGGLVIMLNLTDYTLLTYMPTYLQGPLKLTETAALLLTIGMYAVMLLVINQFGRLSDRIGRKPMWYASSIGFIVLAFPAFLLINRSWATAILGLVVLGVLLVLQLSTISATFPALFPTQVRYAGFAITYNIFTSAFGGTAPAVNEAVIKATGFNLWPAVYMMIGSAIGLVAVFFMPETAGASLRGTEQPDVEKERPVSSGGPEPATS